VGGDEENASEAVDDDGGEPGHRKDDEEADDGLVDGTGSSDLVDPDFGSLIGGAHHIRAHLSVTESQGKSGCAS
jgi:hypothetical protein